MRISDWSSDVCSSDLGVLHVVRDILIFELRAERFLKPDDRAVLDQVDQPLEAALDTDREIQHRRTRAQAILDHADAHLEIRTRAIELVEIGRASCRERVCQYV